MKCAKSIESKGTYLHAKTLLYRYSKVKLYQTTGVKEKISQHHVPFNIIIFTITIQIISITYGAQSSEKETENWFVTHANKQGLAGKHATSPERSLKVQ